MGPMKWGTSTAYLDTLHPKVLEIVVKEVFTFRTEQQIKIIELPADKNKKIRKAKCINFFRMTGKRLGKELSRHVALGKVEADSVPSKTSSRPLLSTSSMEAILAVTLQEATEHIGLSPISRARTTNFYCWMTACQRTGTQLQKRWRSTKTMQAPSSVPSVGVETVASHDLNAKLMASTTSSWFSCFCPTVWSSDPTLTSVLQSRGTDGQIPKTP